MQDAKQTTVVRRPATAPPPPRNAPLPSGWPWAPYGRDGSQGCRRRDTNLLSTLDLKLSAVGLTAADGDPVTP